MGCVRSWLQYVGSLLRHGDLLLVVHTLWLWHMGSVVAVPRGSCSVARRILVPSPGTDPTSPALKGRFLTTGPQGKSLKWHILN